MIDVYINSCARPDVLEKSLDSFKANVRTSHKLRYVILEDKVIDTTRQEEGRKWLDANDDIYDFDIVAYSPKILTYVYAFGEGLKHITSEYFIHLEDDMQFQHPIKFDYYIDIMDKDNRLSSISMKKNGHRYLNPSVSNGIIYNDFFSISTGLFHTARAKKIVGFSGTGECHETKVLSVSMRKLGLFAAVANNPEHDYDILDIGTPQGYVKGKWK